MSTIRFRSGACYVAVPAMRDYPNAIVTVTGRGDGCVTFAQARPVPTAWLKTFNGREVAMVRGDNGIDYTISSAVTVDLGGAQDIMRMANGGHPTSHCGGGYGA